MAAVLRAGRPFFCFCGAEPCGRSAIRGDAGVTPTARCGEPLGATDSAGAGGALLSPSVAPAGWPATLIRLAGHRRDRPPPFGVENSAIRCGGYGPVHNLLRRAQAPPRMPGPSRQRHGHPPGVCWTDTPSPATCARRCRVLMAGAGSAVGGGSSGGAAPSFHTPPKDPDRRPSCSPNSGSTSAGHRLR